MRFRVHWRNNQSQGNTSLEANGKKEAMRILQQRMPHAKITRAELEK